MLVAVHRPTTYGDSFADVYDDWYVDLSDPTSMVDYVCNEIGAGPSPRGRLLELGVGTGRLALPLVRADIDVVGIDASVPMLVQLQSKASSSVPAVAGDMAVLPFADDSFGGALIAYNTFFNLTTEVDQRSCLSELARVLEPGGFAVLEAFVPGPPPQQTEQRVAEASEPGVFIATWQRAGSSVVDGAHITFDGDEVRTRPWRIRATPPDELDAMANDAGLTFVRRSATWTHDRFDAESDTHVSLYRSLS